MSAVRVFEGWDDGQGLGGAAAVQLSQLNKGRGCGRGALQNYAIFFAAMEGEVLDSFRYLDHRQRTFVFEIGTPPQLIYTSVARGLPDAPRVSLPGGPLEARQHSPFLVLLRSAVA